MFSTEEIFDALFDRAAGGEAAGLFGALAEKENRAALHQKLCGRRFSLLFLEVPLAGEAGFDLHLIHDAEDIRRGAPYEDTLYGGYGPLFSWYAEKDRGGDGLDVVYDLREGWDAPPMAYLKMEDDTPDFEGFFRAMGDEGAAARYRAKRKALPDGWRTWYTGVHTRRKGRPIRLGSFLTDGLQKRCAADAGLFARDLGAVGFPAPPSPAMQDKLRELFAFPLQIDIQIDVLEDGSTGDMLGVSLTTGRIGRDALAASFSKGFALDVMRLLEGWGVADGRWKQLPAATFQASALLRSREGDKRRFILSSRLAYVKVRFRGAGPLAYDAKAYLSLQARPA